MQGQEYKKYFICFAYLSLAAKLLWNNACTFVSENRKDLSVVLEMSN